MPGSILYEAEDVPLARPSAYVVVYRYHPSKPKDGGRFELLPNVLCLQIQRRKGADPWTARFRYKMVDPTLSPDDPHFVEDLYPLDSTGSGVVQTDDRLVVKAYRDDGYHELLFDGFAHVSQADLDGRGEIVTFTAAGTPIREWDQKFGGAVVRSAFAPTGLKDFQSNQPARFNPDGRPNASPEDADSGDDPNEFPAFLGPMDPKDRVKGSDVRPWSLAMASRYIIMHGLFKRADGFLDYAEMTKSTYVDVGSLNYLDSLLLATEPTDDNGDGVIDWDDDSTFNLEPIIVQDVEITGMAWPDALARLIEPHGFTFKFILSEDEEEKPTWKLNVYRAKTGTGARKQLGLQKWGESLDPAQTNLGSLSLARDISGVQNVVILDTAPTLYEASFVLAPGFEVDPADVAAWKATPKAFQLNGGDQLTLANRDKYRRFVFDEAGEGHWDLSGGEMSNAAGNLAPVLNPDPDDPNPFAPVVNPDTTDGPAPYYTRRRPGRNTLFSTDTTDKPLRANLSISFEYDGPSPGVWNGTGTWQTVGGGLWRMLDDRLGVYLTPNDPNSWSALDTDDPLPQIAGGKVSLIEMLNDPDRRPKFRLTCVIPDDVGLDVVAGRREGSPTQFQIERRVDARDRFQNRVISRWSEYLVAVEMDPTDDKIVRDDRDKAAAYAASIRQAHESGTFAGSGMIPRLSTAYEIGDQITRIEGRDLSLRQNAGSTLDESPTYPFVVAITWAFDGQQTTTLELSDSRAEPPPFRGGRLDS